MRKRQMPEHGTDPPRLLESLFEELKPHIEELKPHIEKLSEYLRENEEELAPPFKALKAAMPDLARMLGSYLAPMAKQAELVGILGETGWLPFGHAPYHCMEQHGDDAERVDACMSLYYREHWREIRTSLEENLKAYHVDDEARAAFGEALSAHEVGLYRCVCRLLFPEIERMLRSRIPDHISPDRTGSKQLIEILIGTEFSEKISEGRFFGFLFLGRLCRHLYERVDRNNIADVRKDSLPNRHAAVHGLVAYPEHKHSMNMLVMTDYVFQMLPPAESAR